MRHSAKEVSGINSYGIRIVVPEGKVKEILDRLTAAQETINDCYQELRDLGVLVIEDERFSE